MKKILVIGAGILIDSEFKTDIDCKMVYLDKVSLPHVNVMHDLNLFPYPFQDNEFDEIWAEHVLEHVDNLDKVMEELWRIAKPCGAIKILVPAWMAWQAYADPTHKRFFTRESFDFWDASTHLGRERGYYISQKAKFKAEKKLIRFKGPFLSFFQPLFNKYYNFYRSYLVWIFPANDIRFELEVIKFEKS
ncbi:MAG: class I SAM-dependent methyltransferase [Candidatus Omnitrophica bacterium]|nr:class I SAM-dependent methyltransferase [Candidatus Omnitrophota bacterium]